MYVEGSQARSQDSVKGLGGKSMKIVISSKIYKNY